MGQNDNNSKASVAEEEEDMFIDRVCCGEYELLYLDTYLRETIGCHKC